jgi:hypothetical protein
VTSHAADGNNNARSSGITAVRRSQSDHDRISPQEPQLNVSSHPENGMNVRLFSICNVAVRQSPSDLGRPSPQGPRPNVTSYAADGASNATFASTVAVQDSRSPLTQFTMDDLSLLHHWTLSTSLSIAESRPFHSYWQSIFPQMALDHPYMMHGILSVAALHLAHLHTGNSEKYLVTAARHHNIALRGFQDTLGSVDDQNSDALFACSNLNVIYVLRISVEHCSTARPDSDSTDRISQALGAEWIPMLRGVEAVLSSVYPRVSAGPLRAMLDTGNWDAIDPDTSSSAEQTHLRAVCEIWSGAGADPVYDGALYFLRKCCVYVRQFDGRGGEESGGEPTRLVWVPVLVSLRTRRLLFTTPTATACGACAFCLLWRNLLRREGFLVCWRLWQKHCQSRGRAAWRLLEFVAQVAQGDCWLGLKRSHSRLNTE